MSDYAKLQELLDALRELNKALVWANNNLDKARKNIDNFHEKYVKKVDDIYLQLDDEDKKIIDKYI